MIFRAPKQIKKIDKFWWFHNAWELIAKAFAIGGILQTSIVFLLLIYERDWPNCLNVAAFVVAFASFGIYGILHMLYEWQAWPEEIMKKYSTPQPKKK